MKTVLSPNRHKGRIKPIRLVVLHSTESLEVSDGAENVAAYLARPSTRASAHVITDNDSSVRGVPDADTAWAAPGANADGLQLEMVGKAGQTSAQWDDAYSRAVLERSAQQVAEWCRTHGIPARALTVAQVRDGKTEGICTHDDVSKAFGRSSHWDPGPSFPKAVFVARVNELLGGAAPAPAPVSPGGLVVDGYAGPATIRRWQQVMGTTPDGVISGQGAADRARHVRLASMKYGGGGSELVRAVQRAVGTHADGYLGPTTIAAVQRRLGVTPDGYFGPATVTALQQRLNTGRF